MTEGGDSRRREEGNPSEELERLRRLCHELQSELTRGRESDRDFLRQVLDIIPDFVFAKDRDGRFTLVNRAVAEAYGTTVEGLVGKTDSDFNPSAEEVEHFRLDDLDVMENLREKVIAEESITDAQGCVRWLQTIKRPILDPDGVARQVLGVSHDITRHKELEQRLSNAALHDALTGLPNRTLFRDRLAMALARTRARRGAPFAVLFLDLDRFKWINDSWGHRFGDVLLEQIGARFLTVVRPGDTVARLGGDEFVFLVHDIGQVSDAEAFALRIQSEIRRPFEVNGRDVFVSASQGIVTSSPRYDDPDDLLRDADTAMYRAKARGGGAQIVFHPEMHAAAVSHLELENDLRRAVDRSELELVYQPIVRIAPGPAREGGAAGVQPAACEALLRWRHPKLGVLAPSAFLAIAEETGLIFALDEWALRQACRDAASRNARAGETFTVSVNVSSRHLYQEHLPGLVSTVLQESGLASACLRLEITESTFLQHAPAVDRVLAEIKRLGVAVDLDDFGIGYSSLSRLAHLPIDRLKIDRSFIAGLADSASREIVRAAISLAHGLGMEAVAEGVERDDQLALLREFGCDFGQGHWFGAASCIAEPAGSPGSDSP